MLLCVRVWRLDRVAQVFFLFFFNVLQVIHTTPSAKHKPVFCYRHHPSPELTFCRFLSLSFCLPAASVLLAPFENDLKLTSCQAYLALAPYIYASNPRRLTLMSGAFKWSQNFLVSLVFLVQKRNVTFFCSESQKLEGKPMSHGQIRQFFGETAALNIQNTERACLWFIFVISAVLGGSKSSQQLKATIRLERLCPLLVCFHCGVASAPSCPYLCSQRSGSVVGAITFSSDRMWRSRSQTLRVLSPA